MRKREETTPKRIDAIKNLPILEIDDEAIKLGAQILKSGVIPQKAAADAGHIAVAARHGIHYLLTWNCKHSERGNRQETGSSDPGQWVRPTDHLHTHRNPWRPRP